MRGSCGKTVRGSFVGTWMGKTTELEISIWSSKIRIILIEIRGWKNLMKNVDFDEPTSFLDHKIWDAFNVNVNRTK